MEKIVLDKEIILNATEEVIRRFGPEKANITDVAKSLKVSHAAIYRYYSGKTALWNAVTERWLIRLYAPLNDIIKEDGPADSKLFHLLEAFAESKCRSAIHDTEMFSNYLKLAQNSMEAIQNGIEYGINCIQVIIEQGMREGVFFTESPHQSAKAVYLAISVFVYPKSFEDPERQQNIASVVSLLIKGLKNSNN